MHLKSFFKSISASAVLLTFALISCSPGFDSATVYSVIDDEKANNALIYEEVAADGRIFSKTILKAPPDKPSDSKNEKTTKSPMQVLEGDSIHPHIGVVFVGDGYAQKDMAQYNQDVVAIFNSLVTQEPFKSYRRYFTFYRIDYTSTQSGVGTKASGGLGMHYNCNNLPRLLCVSTSKVMNEARNAPRADIVFAMANSSEYGGAGYRNPTVATLAARHPSALDLALHEVGHSFAGLGDEYDDEGVSTDCNSYPNISHLSFAEMQREKKKWHRWLDVKDISSYRGACYSSKFNRPLLESKMRNLTAPFGEVNLEQFIMKIYRQVKPVKFATDTKTIKMHISVQVEPMRPASHGLNIDWFLDGVTQPALQNKFSVETRSLKITKRTHTLKAIVTDRTPSVRDEEFRKKYMQQTLEWKLKLL